MIYLVVRRTTDWQNETLVRAQIPERLRPTVELWDATFVMPYHLFRSELKRIAQLNMSHVDGAICVARDEVPVNAIVVPVDDDDWFSPRLASVLDARVDEGPVGYYWPSRFIEVPISLPHRLGLIRRVIFPRTPPKWLCTTNNYAVVMSFETAPLIENHIEASRWFVAHPKAVKRLDESLSVMNRTLASITSLRSRPSRLGLVRKFHEYERLYDQPVSPDLSWCKPYIAMMRDLMAALRLRE